MLRWVAYRQVDSYEKQTLNNLIILTIRLMFKTKLFV